MSLFPIIRYPAWVDEAACADPAVDISIFFPDPGHQPAEARTVCASCVVKTQCLQMALAVEDGISAASRHGVYAGLTPHQRAHISNTRPKERTA